MKQSYKSKINLNYHRYDEDYDALDDDEVDGGINVLNTPEQENSTELYKY